MKTQRTIQLILAVALIATGLRLAWIYHERHTPLPRRTEQPTALDPDYYVVPRKLYAYDVKTARAAMAGHPAWVREGYKFTYYRFDPARKRADFAHAAGLLAPLEKLEILDVVETPPPSAGELPQVVAAFSRDGQQFAVPIGARRGDDYTLYADDMFFFDDPRQLYRHWSSQVWQAVDSHRVLPGMNEIQAGFALGMGVPQAGGGDTEKTVVYPNDGKQTTVVFRGGKAAEITP